MMRKTKATEIAPKTSESFPLWGGAADSFRAFADMDRWFEDIRREFGRVLTPWTGTPLALEDGVRVPAVDVRDEGTEFVVTAELPGVSKDQVEIEATPGSLEIRAELRGEREEKDEKYYFRERTFRGYRRSLDLPAEVVPEKAAAQLKDGVLEIRLPKKEPTPAPKAVQVKVQ